MKKIFIVLFSLVALFGFMSCDQGTTEDPAAVAETTTDDALDFTLLTASTTWWMKGSFDGWKDSGADKHWFAVDAADANILTYKITSLRALDYEFVLVNGTTEMKYSTADNVSANTQFVMDVTGAAGINASFTAATVSYLVRVDITDPAAPKVTLVPSTTASTAYSEAELAAALKIKGDAFSIGWTDTAGTYDAVAKTVSFDVTMNNKNGSFGIQALEGFVKCDPVASPATAGVTSTAVELTTTAANNISITTPPKKNSVYTVTVAIDTTKAINAGRYMMTIAIKTMGTAEWAFAAPAAIYLVGTVNGWAHAAFTTYAAGVGNTEWTATIVDPEFKLTPAANWDNGEFNINTIVVDAASLPLTGTGGIKFTAVVGSTYIIAVDFTTAVYIADGKPTVKVTLKP